MQNITISGNLTSDVKVAHDQNGREFMSFRVAVNDRRRNEDTTTFYDVTGAKTGVFDYLSKGQGVIVSGKLSIFETEKDGKKYNNIQVAARDIELTGGRKED